MYGEETDEDANDLVLLKGFDQTEKPQSHSS